MADKRKEDDEVIDQLNALIGSAQLEKVAAESSDNLDAQLEAVVAGKPVQSVSDNKDDVINKLDALINGEEIVAEVTKAQEQQKPIVSVLLEKAKAYLKEKIDSTNWQKMLVTPMGEYYVKLGERFPFSDQLMEKAGVPQTFPVPAFAKYSPTAVGVGSAAGIDWKTANDRFALGVFIDQLIMTKGIKYAAKLCSGIKYGKIGEFMQSIAEEGKMSVEAAEMMRREAAKPGEQLQLALTKQESLPFGHPPAPAKSAVAETVEQVAADQAEQLRLVMDGYAEQTKLFPDEVMVGFRKYKDTAEGFMEVKPLNKVEAAALASQAHKIDGVLPELGEVDIVSSATGRKKNLGSRIFSSPQNVVPKLHELALEKKTLMQDLVAKYVEPVVTRFRDTIGKNIQSAERVFKTLDGVENHADMAGVILNAEEAEMVKILRNTFNEIADLIYTATHNPAFKPGQRMTNYITHVIEQTKGQKMLMSDSLQELERLMTDLKAGEKVSAKQLGLVAKKMRQAGMGKERLSPVEGTITTGKRYLKPRTGAQGYSVDPFKALNEYVKWAGDFISDRAVKGKWDMVRELYHPDLRSYADWYWDNIKNIPKDSEAIRKMSGLVTKLTRNAALGLNNVSALINATQSFYFGAARIGYGPWMRGVRKYVQYLRQTGNPESLKQMKELLIKSDIEDVVDNFFRARAAKAKGVLAQTGHVMDTVSMKMFQEVEKFNRATTYLGAYDDVVYKINQLKQFGPTTMKRTAKWLSDRGIKATGDLDWEAHKYAMKSMSETQFDLAKMYQSQFASNSLAKVLFQFSNFPIKTGGHVIQPFKEFGQQFAQHGFKAFTLPGTKNLLRLAVNSAIFATAAKASGIDVTRFALGNMMLVSEGPAMKFVRSFLDTYKAAVEQPGTYTMQQLAGKFMGDLATGIIPGSIVGRRLYKFMDAFVQNQGKDMWDIRDPKTGKVKYQVSPMSAVKMLVVPTAEEETYWDLVKQDTDATTQMRDAGRKISKMKVDMINASFEQRERIKRQLGEIRLRQREAALRKRQIRMERKKMKGGAR